MSKIERLPSGSYRTRLYLGTDPDGKKLYKSLTAPSRPELKMLINQYRNEHRQPTGLTVSVALENYISSSSAELSPSTIRGYKACQKALSRYPDLMKKRVDVVTKRDIQLVIDDMTKEKTSAGKTIAAKTVHERFHLLTAVFAHYDIYLHGVKLPRKKRPEIAVPDENRIRATLEAIKGTELEVPVLLACFGGLRRGEICALDISDIQGNIIHVSKDMILTPDKEWIIKDIPKTYESNRYIEMPQKIIDLIKEKGYITNLNPNALTNRHRRFLKSHGLPHCRIHDYRHYMVSSLHAIGIPDAYIMRRGGWSSDKLMKTVYRHTLEDRNKQEVQKALNHFDSIL